MGDQIKKISFGFSKLAKKTAIVSTHLNKVKQEDDVGKVELIDCFEGKSIKLKDPIQVNQGPLIIPLTRQKEEKSLIQNENSEISSNLKLKNEVQNKQTNEASESLIAGITGKSNFTDQLIKSDSQNKHETLEEIAAREILEELNKKKTEEDEKRVFSVPLTSNAPSGEKESTIDDYDNIPVTEFGMAMLRGMGWAPGKGIGKTEKLVTPSLPTPRPKGMGLGADQVMKSVHKKSSKEDLKMVKGSFVRVLAGPEKDSYGHIEGFDDESGRLIIKLALKNSSISLNEFMVQLVDSNEFKKNSKVINVSKYEQYKKDEIKKESTESKPQESHSKEPINRNSSKNYNDNRSRVLKKYQSSESEEENLKDSKTKTSSESTSRYVSPKRRSSSGSPHDKNRRNESSRYQPKSHKSQSTKHVKDSTYHCKSNKSDYKKERSYSSDNSSSSGTYANRNKTNNSLSKNRHRPKVNERSMSRRRSNSNVSTSSDSSGLYSRKKKNKHKKSSSNKYRSRSRSRSPRKHKQTKSKKYS